MTGLQPSCNGAPTSTYWSISSELTSMTTVKVSAQLGVNTTRGKVTTKVKNLVVVKVKLLFNTIQSY